MLRFKYLVIWIKYLWNLLVKKQKQTNKKTKTKIKSCQGFSYFLSQFK